MTKTQKIVMWFLIIITVLLLSRFVIFKEQFDTWGEGLQNIEVWQTQYKKDNPGATKDEMDAAFEADLGNISLWKSEYKQKNPGATDAEVDAAFNAMWKK